MAGERARGGRAVVEVQACTYARVRVWAVEMARLSPGDMSRNGPRSRNEKLRLKNVGRVHSYRSRAPSHFPWRETGALLSPRFALVPYAWLSLKSHLPDANIMFQPPNLRLVRSNFARQSAHLFEKLWIDALRRDARFAGLLLFLDQHDLFARRADDRFAPILVLARVPAPRALDDFNLELRHVLS